LKEKTIDKLQVELEEARNIIMKLSQENKRQNNFSSFEEKDPQRESKEGFFQKDDKGHSSSHKNNMTKAESQGEKILKNCNKDETYQSIENNKRIDDTTTNNYLSFQNKDSAKGVDNSDYFRKSNRVSIANDERKNGKQQGKSIEDMLKSTVKLIEKSNNGNDTPSKNQERTFSNYTRNRDTFLKTEETLKKIRNRTQGLLEKYSQNLISLSTNAAKMKEK